VNPAQAGHRAEPIVLNSEGVPNWHFVSLSLKWQQVRVVYFLWLHEGCSTRNNADPMEGEVAGPLLWDVPVPVPPPPVQALTKLTQH
jgi:hypothetical protein